MISSEFLGLLAIIAGGWYWYAAMRAKELVREAGRLRCRENGLVFLDESVVLTRVQLRRADGGGMALQRRYRFEFTPDGHTRYGGEITACGGRVVGLEMEPYREG